MREEKVRKGRDDEQKNRQRRRPLVVTDAFQAPRCERRGAKRGRGRSEAVVTEEDTTYTLTMNPPIEVDFTASREGIMITLLRE